MPCFSESWQMAALKSNISFICSVSTLMTVFVASSIFSHYLIYKLVLTTTQPKKIAFRKLPSASLRLPFISFHVFLHTETTSKVVYTNTMSSVSTLFGSRTRNVSKISQVKIRYDNCSERRQILLLKIKFKILVATSWVFVNET